MTAQTNQKTTQGPSGHGPADPFHPIGDPEILLFRPGKVSVTRQEYEDGHIWEYVVPRGRKMDAEATFYSVPLHCGDVISAWSDTKTSYLSVWLPRSGDKTTTSAVEGTPMAFEFGHCQPTGETQVLHESSSLYVIRIPYDGGWLYRVIRTLGIPWPDPREVTCLQTVVGNPVIGVEVYGLLYVTKFWIPADKAPA